MSEQGFVVTVRDADWENFHCPPDTPHVLVGAGGTERAPWPESG